jgi:hypothetical protein
MKFSWRPLASGHIEALVIASEWELSSLGTVAFWSKVTTELPVGCYTVVMRMDSLVLGQCTLRLMGWPGPLETALV